jgi:putative Holliday junction resolvase
LTQAVPPTGRVLGVDFGEARIGLAVSDAAQVTATGRGLIVVRDDPAAADVAVAREVEELEAVGVVVGVPIAMSGELGAEGRGVLSYAERLRVLLEVPVVLEDERLTTAVASRGLRDSGSRRRSERDRVDEAAATVILQSWLDKRRAS